MITTSSGEKTHHSPFFSFFEALLKKNLIFSSDSQDSVICTYNLIL